METTMTVASVVADAAAVGGWFAGVLGIAAALAWGPALVMWAVRLIKGR